MKKNQNLVWRYLTLHRKITGQSLSYLKLLQYGHYQKQALALSQQAGDAELTLLAEQAHAWLLERRRSPQGAVSTATKPVRQSVPAEGVPQPVALGLQEQVIPPAADARRGKPHDGGPRRVLGAASLVGVALGVIASVAFLGGSWVGQDKASVVAVEQAAAPAPADTIVHVRDAIDHSQTWQANHTYVLEAPIFVESGAALSIEPGTRILGMPGSALIVTKDAKLYARGQRHAPIIFTSAKPVGERNRGDWGGLVLLGNAPINQGTARIEGVDEKDPRGLFGGEIIGDNCGLLEYVRIEFSGHEVFVDNELNGLTLGGCGHKTIVRNVQVHRSLDDGVEVFGGDVDLKNIVVTGAKDDGFDWDMGWQGRVQFLVVQQYPDVGDNAFEADNWKKDHDALPRSAPTFFNVTLIGGLNAKKAQRAMTLRRGTAGQFRNFVITGFNKEAIDVRDARTAALATSGELQLANSLFYEIGVDGRSYFSAEPPGETDDDQGFDELAFFKRAELHNRFGQAPLLSEDAFHEAKPNFTPLPMSPASEGAAVPPEDEFWDQGASYLGAIPPGSSRPWLVGWTAYPKA